MNTARFIICEGPDFSQLRTTIADCGGVPLFEAGNCASHTTRPQLLRTAEIEVKLLVLMLDLKSLLEGQSQEELEDHLVHIPVSHNKVDSLLFQELALVCKEALHAGENVAQVLAIGRAVIDLVAA